MNISHSYISSIERAVRLLESSSYPIKSEKKLGWMSRIGNLFFKKPPTPIESEPYFRNFLMIKLSNPEGFVDWDRIYEQTPYFYTYSGSFPRKDDFIIDDRGRSPLVVEIHETGPEILIYLGFIAASLQPYVASIIDILKTFIEARGNSTAKFKIRTMDHNGVVDEIEVSLPLSSKTARDLEKFVNEEIQNAIHFKGRIRPPKKRPAKKE